MFIVENIPPRHVRVKYQLDSEHFTMCVFVMRISGNKVISNPELDVENRWYKILESRQTDLCSTSAVHVLVKYFRIDRFPTENIYMVLFSIEAYDVCMRSRTYFTSIWARMSDFITSQTFHTAKCISTFVHTYKRTQYPLFIRIEMS